MKDSQASVKITCHQWHFLECRAFFKMQSRLVLRTWFPTAFHGNDAGSSARRVAWPIESNAPVKKLTADPSLQVKLINWCNLGWTHVDHFDEEMAPLEMPKCGNQFKTHLQLPSSLPTKMLKKAAAGAQAPLLAIQGAVSQTPFVGQMSGMGSFNLYNISRCNQTRENNDPERYFLCYFRRL